MSRWFGVVKTAALEIFGLFVEDGVYAVSILVWLAVVALLLPRLVGPSSRIAALVFGLIAILVEDVWRSARVARRVRASAVARRASSERPSVDAEPS